MGLLRCQRDNKTGVIFGRGVVGVCGVPRLPFVMCPFSTAVRAGEAGSADGHLAPGKTLMENVSKSRTISVFQ